MPLFDPVLMSGKKACERTIVFQCERGITVFPCKQWIFIFRHVGGIMTGVCMKDMKHKNYLKDENI